MRTINEVLNEVNDIITDNYVIGERLETLKSCSYNITFTWAKNGGVGSYYYHTHRKIYRIQVSESEIRGRYHTAWFIELPATLISDK